MPVEELNHQLRVLGQDFALSQAAIDTIEISEPHILAVELNGRTLQFRSGGTGARTHISNHLTRSAPASDAAGDRSWSIDQTRVGTIVFDVEKGFVTLDEALSLAQRACEAARSAGLSVEAGASPFGAITASSLTHPLRDLTSREDQRRAFLSEDIQAVRINFCTLEDLEHSFGVEVRNSRRARHDAGLRARGSLNDSRSYRVSASLVQN
jgi:hypothetical protein